ncbi:MAG: hypothetical protein GF411_19930 [Candidatus Lokiarchaeota archaeon]|nr:hypothetical protein [Candidatus Lokiarchaeota archaeon]
MREEGFWSDNPEQEPWPMEREAPWDGQSDFVMMLGAVENALKTSDLGKIVAYRGYSHCRICDQLNGSKEYHYNEWIWPQGFKHYIESHNVMPSQDFMDMITGEYVNMEMKMTREIGKATKPEKLMEWDDNKLIGEIKKQVRSDWGGLDRNSAIKFIGKELLNRGLPSTHKLSEFIYDLVQDKISGCRNRIDSKVKELRRRLSQ